MIGLSGLLPPPRPRASATSCAAAASSSCDSRILVAWMVEIDSPGRHGGTGHAGRWRRRSLRQRKNWRPCARHRPRRGSAGRPQCRDRRARPHRRDSPQAPHRRERRDGRPGGDRLRPADWIRRRRSLRLHWKRPSWRSTGAKKTASSSARRGPAGSPAAGLGVEELHAMIEIVVLQARPARFMALVGVVGMLTMGIFGAARRGL